MGWTDDSGIGLWLEDSRYITLEKLLEEIGEKQKIFLVISGVIPAHIPDELSQCVIHLRLDEVRITDKHCTSTW